MNFALIGTDNALYTKTKLSDENENNFIHITETNVGLRSKINFFL